MSYEEERMRSIYEYNDYRDYLKDFFNIQKKRKYCFSQRYFAKKAGFRSHSFCGYVIRGKRNLREESINKMIKGLGLSGRKASFFRELVYYTQTENSEEKETKFRRMNQLRRHTEYYRLNKDHYKYFQNWYMPVVRHVAGNFDWKDDYEYLASKIRPRITEQQCREAVETLLNIGLLEKKDGKYILVDKHLIYDHVPVVYRKKARRQVMEHGIKAAENYSNKERYISYATMTMTKKTYERIIKLLEEAQKESVNTALNDESAEQVYQMIMQMFPVSGDLRDE